jgi:predicted ribosomally synthesized peptide with SipW-like signal peptide
MTDERFKLTRRKALAGLGSIGVAGAGAGLGTSALFSDTESFEDNSITAGRLNMQVSADIVGKSPNLPEPEINGGSSDTADGSAVTIEVLDMKPGDWVLIEWHPEVFFNPGYVQVTSVDDDYANNEGANTEPEGDTTPPGDLGDALLSTVWQGYMGGGMNPRQDVQNLDETTNNSTTGLGSYESPDLDGVTPSGAHYTTANEAHEVYKTGVLLRDPNTGDPLEVGNSNPGTPPGAHFWQLLELPTAVGNDIQGDELVFTLRFDTEQVRNNDEPFQ